MSNHYSPVSAHGKVETPNDDAATILPLYHKHAASDTVIMGESSNSVEMVAYICMNIISGIMIVITNKWIFEKYHFKFGIYNHFH